MSVFLISHKKSAREREINLRVSLFLYLKKIILYRREGEPENVLKAIPPQTHIFRFY